jgi:hypothetical protein
MTSPTCRAGRISRCRSWIRGGCSRYVSARHRARGRVDITAILLTRRFSVLSIRYLPFASPTFPVRYSLLASFFRFSPPRRGACGAPLALGCMRRTQIGMPYTLMQDARERACDRHADASLDPQPGNARLAFLAHRREAPACDRFAQSERPSSICVEASCIPSDGNARLSALHVGFLARARACRCPACPPRSCGNLICRTGHRYPEERVSRTSPARSLTASGTPRPRSALQGRP